MSAVVASHLELSSADPSILQELAHQRAPLMSTQLFEALRFTNSQPIPFNIFQFLHIIKCQAEQQILRSSASRELFAAQLELLTKFLRFTRPDLQHQDIPIT
jgi:hypothetical protein